MPKIESYQSDPDWQLAQAQLRLEEVDWRGTSSDRLAKKVEIITDMFHIERGLELTIEEDPAEETAR